MAVELLLPDNQPVRVANFNISTDGKLPDQFAEAAELVWEGWLRRRAANPHLFNGSVFLTSDIKLDDGCLSGRAARTDYANFLHWRGNASFQTSVSLHHIFPVAAIESADGVLIAVRASSNTLNAGKVYFAGGNFDDGDVSGVRLDPHHNMRREVLEETGLNLSVMAEGNGWVAVRSNWFVAVFKHYTSPMQAIEFSDLILGHVGRQNVPENDACVLIRDAGDISSNMPQYMQAYCRYHFSMASTPHSPESGPVNFGEMAGK